MPAKLSRALEFANYRVTLNTQQEAVKARVNSLLSYSVNGGTFSIDRELIVFCNMLLSKKISSTILLDDYNNPIPIDKLDEFLEEIFSRYHEVTNDYFVEYEKLKKSRKVHKIVDIDDEK